MHPRAYSWPDGHWDWYRHLAFKHGNRVGQFIHVGGQVDKTSEGEPLHAGDLATQIDVVVGHIDRVLAGFGAGLADTVKLTAFWANDGDVDEAWFLERVARACIAHGVPASGPGPAIVPVPLPWLALPGMRVEIEAIAMLGESGERLERSAAEPDGAAALPAPFSHALRCGEHVFVGAQSDADADAAFERLADALGRLGAGPQDLARVAMWHAADLAEARRAAAFARHVLPHRAAYVELPAPRLDPGVTVQADGWAVCGSAATREVLTTGTPWRRAGREAAPGGIRIGDLVFLSSQLALDANGDPMHAGDLNAQTRLAVERVQALLADAGLGLDHMVKQTSYFHGAADPQVIVANQTLRSSFYREPAGASTGVPLVDFGVDGALVSIDTIAAA